MKLQNCPYFSPSLPLSHFFFLQNPPLATFINVVSSTAETPHTNPDTNSFRLTPICIDRNVSVIHLKPPLTPPFHTTDPRMPPPTPHSEPSLIWPYSTSINPRLHYSPLATTLPLLLSDYGNWPKWLMLFTLSHVHSVILYWKNLTHT